MFAKISKSVSINLTVPTEQWSDTVAVTEDRQHLVLLKTNFSRSCFRPLPQSHRVESYVTADVQSASLSWNKAPIWGLRPDFYYCQTVAGLLMWGALSDERTGLLFTIAAGPCQSRGTRDHILLTQIRDFPFRRLPRLAGLRWRYSTPPPHGIVTSNGSACLIYCPYVDLFSNTIQVR
jgi:hypothetical protein